MMAYLVQMAIRLVHMHRVLKPTGTPVPPLRPDGQPLPEDHAGCHLRADRFWQRDHLEEDERPRQRRQRYGPVHDIILFYAKGRRLHVEYQSTIRTSRNT